MKHSGGSCVWKPQLLRLASFLLLQNNGSLFGCAFGATENRLQKSGQRPFGDGLPNALQGARDRIGLVLGVTIAGETLT